MENLKAYIKHQSPYRMNSLKYEPKPEDILELNKQNIDQRLSKIVKEPELESSVSNPYLSELAN